LLHRGKYFQVKNTASNMLGKIITVITLLVMKATATIYYAGVAESGGEFGVYSMSQHRLTGE
jgi:endoglucanase